MNIFHNRFQFITLFFSVLLCAPIYTQYAHLESSITFEHQTHNRDITKNKSHHGFSYNNTRGTVSKSPTHTPHFSKFTAQDFQHYFTARGYTENQILNQPCLYMFDDFVKFAKTYSRYACTIREMYVTLKNLNFLQKACYAVTGNYCSGLQKRIQFLYNELNTITPVLRTEPIIYSHSPNTQLSEYDTLNSTYRAYTPSLSNAIEKRLRAYSPTSINTSFERQYATQPYNLNNNIKQLLHKHKYDTSSFEECFGTKLNHAIHQESLDILNGIYNLPRNSILYDHKGALIDLTVAMVEYNHEDITNKAMTIGDLCWTLLDYGQAVAEGAALGVYSMAHDILTNPIEATVCIVAGKQMLAYQLCKVFYNVADIGIIAITNVDRAKDKWNTYTEPVNNIINAISKKEITVRDAIKNGTAFVVGYKAQSKLLGGLGKFCNTIKQKSINFVKKNSLVKPQEYLATPEGLLFKATADPALVPKKQVTNPEEYLLHNVPDTKCPASCPNQYGHFKELLRIKEFTSILKVTRHGIERLIEREYTPLEALAVIKHPSFTKIQHDGSIAYIKQIQNRFNVIILSDQTNEVITAFKNFDQKALNNLGKNYGWK